MYRIEISDGSGTDSAFKKFLNQKIFENSFSKIGHYRYEPLVLIVRDDKNNIVGGVHGHTGLGWLYVDVLWVAEDIREKGYGTQLIKRAEKEAARRGCHGVYLYTYSFQQFDFYKKIGYEIFGQLDDFPLGHVKYFVKESLVFEKNGT